MNLRTHYKSKEHVVHTKTYLYVHTLSVYSTSIDKLSMMPFSFVWFPLSLAGIEFCLISFFSSKVYGIYWSHTHKYQCTKYYRITI